MDRLKIISLNVRGLRSSGKSTKIIQELDHLNCDVTLLQETHVSCKKEAQAFQKLWKGKGFWSFGTGKSAGVAVLFSLGFSGKIIRFLTDSDRRILSLVIDFHNLKFNVVNIYSPNTASDCKLFFSDLHNYVISQGLLLMGGEFNCINNVLDKFNCSFVPATDKNSLASLMSDVSLVDIWRKRHPRKIMFSWSNTNRTQASRIDRFFIAKSLVCKVVSCEILRCVLSDHNFILDVLLDGLSKRGAGVWRFNNSSLSDLDFKNVLSKMISDFKLQIPNFLSLREWWDCLKIEIRKACISFSIRKHR